MMKAKKEKEKYVKVRVNPRFCYLTPSKEKIRSEFARDVAYGLARKNKFIHPKHFYDETGSKIFDKICELPEYYLTRTEVEILRSLKKKLPSYLKGNYVLIELGSGSSTKTKEILELLLSRQESLDYYPIDISNILKQSSVSLQRRFSNLQIIGILDQYEPALQFTRTLEEQKLIVFLGSSLGNFDITSSVKFLSKVKKSMKPNDFLLLGIDLVKDKKILERAYNDSSGVTRDFNMNLISRINKELDANFDLEKFEHVAIFNKKHNRIEMYLKSKEENQAEIPVINLLIKLKKGEMIHTEFSYKYTFSQIEKIAKKVGLRLVKKWTDKQNYFALVLLSV